MRKVSSATLGVSVVARAAGLEDAQKVYIHDRAIRLSSYSDPSNARLSVQTGSHQLPFSSVPSLGTTMLCGASTAVG